MVEVAGTAGLPHSHECGPVEARMRRGRRASHLALPHSHECGPVEALLGTSQIHHQRRSFRTLTSAAPLKQAHHRLVGEPLGSFRTLTSAAPLKHNLQTPLLARPAALPHSHECGPVEARRRWGRGRALCWPSALSRVRPR